MEKAGTGHRCPPFFLPLAPPFPSPEVIEARIASFIHLEERLSGHEAACTSPSRVEQPFRAGLSARDLHGVGASGASVFCRAAWLDQASWSKRPTGATWSEYGEFSPFPQWGRDTAAVSP
jgi:hypothetical protein